MSVHDIPTPALDKLARNAEEFGTQSVGEFLDWLDEQGIRLCTIPDGYTDTFLPIQEGTRRLLARYADITPEDEKQAEEERRALLDTLRG